MKNKENKVFFLDIKIKAILTIYTLLYNFDSNR